MRYPPADLLALLRTPIGRRKVRRAVRHELWPVSSRLAGLHRRLVVPHVRVVAVVGSLGKTTAAHAASAALGLSSGGRGGNALGSIATGVLGMRRRDRHAVFEVGIAGPGQMAPYARVLRPDVVVVTSIGTEHRRALGSVEATRHEKAEMVRALPDSGLAVLNGDDPNVRWMAGQTGARVVTFGLEPGNDVRARDLELVWPEGSRFVLSVHGETRTVETRLLGRAMVYPVLAAVAVAVAEGLELAGILARLAALEPAPSRLEPFRLPSGAIVLRDERKSSLESVEAALDVLAAVPAGRRTAVLGDVDDVPGSQGPVYRALGERLAGAADRVVLVGRGRRNYAAGARRAGMAPAGLVDAGQSARAAAQALGSLGPGDVLLVKGRGTQRLERVVLALEGRAVACDIPECHARGRCAACPMLERGWDGLRVVT